MPRQLIRNCLIAVGVLASIPTAMASSFAPVILYGGEIADGSFNESIHQGVIQFEEESQIDVVEKSISYQAHRFPVVLLDAIKSGAMPIITFPSTASEVRTLSQFAELHPQHTFVVMDQEVHLPNVHSILFKEQEASFLAGVLAGMASQSAVVGFVGGIDNVVIRERFAHGFRQGLMEVNPGITMLEEYIGRTATAWFKPERGYALARRQIQQGADVLFHAAGQSGRGVLRAAAEAGRLGIGVDLNQNGLYPGQVLTSVIKRNDRAIYLVLRDAQAGLSLQGVRLLGLAEDAVSLAMDQHNAPLITPAMRARIEPLEARIRSGARIIRGSGD